jgi:hypothetical protein
MWIRWIRIRNTALNITSYRIALGTVEIEVFQIFYLLLEGSGLDKK